MVKYMRRQPRCQDWARAAKARGNALRVHYKNTRETAACLKGMTIPRAKRFLKNVMKKKEIVPFRRHSGITVSYTYATHLRIRMLLACVLTVCNTRANVHTTSDMKLFEERIRVIHIYIYIYTVCVCVCMCMCEKVGLEDTLN